MEHFPNHELEYIVDDYYDVTDFEDDDDVSPRSGSSSMNDDSPDSDFEDDFELSKSGTETSALEARNGKDIQGIPWERFNFTRDTYRESRLKQYRNYESLSCSREDLEKKCKEVEKGHNFYDFQFNTQLVKSTIVHFQAIKSTKVLVNLTSLSRCCFRQQRLFFLNIVYSFCCITGFSPAVEAGLQFSLSSWRSKDTFHMLRNLLWATSKHDVYLMQNYSVMHWSSLLRRGKEVLNVARPVVPTLKDPDCMAQTLSRVQISTMSVKENLMVAGGFQGELICKHLNQHGVAFCTKLSADGNAITNSVDIYRSHGGSTRVITANNDAQVRVFDAENFACLNRFMFPWSVNNTSISPDGKSLAVLGDGVDCLIADTQSGKVLSTLKGHLDYSFASAWHPDGRILATGNQDTTCRLWDIRNLSESLAVINGRMGAIRAIRFTSDGRFMAMAEPADFVHLFDTRSDYARGQEIDLFGEIAGISFSPDSDALFVGVSDRTYGSLLEFNRRHCDNYLECIF